MSFELAVRSIFERLDRIEAALGITEPVPSQAALEEWVDDETGAGDE